MKCDCSTCSAFDPEPEPDFDACGGDPTGLWQLIKDDVSRFNVKINAPEKSWSCEGTNVQAKSTPVFILALNRDATGALFVVEPEQEVDYTESCLTSCSVSDTITCERMDCGVCHCDMPSSVSNSGALSWKASGGVLSWTAGQSQQSLPFCIQGDTLEAQGTDNNSHLTFQRVYGAGRPVDCTPDRTDCDNPTCTPSDYGRPGSGCTLSKVPTVCAGTASPCFEQPKCGAPGCSPGTGCVAAMTTAVLSTKACPCAQLSATDCENTLGCTLMAP